MSLEKPVSAPATDVISTGRIVVLFALLGPLVGSLPLTSVLALLELSGGADEPLFGLVLASAYIYGTLPAALTGFAVAQSQGSAVPTPLRGALFGVIIAALFSPVVFGGLGGFVLFAAMGGVAGLLCGFASNVVERLSRRHR